MPLIGTNVAHFLHKRHRAIDKKIVVLVEMRVEDRHNLHTPYPQIITDKIDVDLIANLKTELAGRILRDCNLTFVLVEVKIHDFPSTVLERIKSAVALSLSPFKYTPLKSDGVFRIAGNAA